MSSALHITHTRCRSEIIRAILYFDIFSYPLKRREIYENAALECTMAEMDAEIDLLIAEGVLRQSEGLVMMSWLPDAAAERRREGNRRAGEMLPLALQYSRRIARFPFVEGVYLSGGLSKNYFDERSDIDYFIVTRTGRLWICRTLLILRYKLLPRGKKKFWCTNYFVSADELRIPDVNRFTATELSHLVPTVNYPLYRRLLRENDWYRLHLPNKQPAAAGICLPEQRGAGKCFAEYLFPGIIGDLVDDLLLKVTLRHWRRKFPEMPEEDFLLQYRTRKTVCKRHNTGYQNKVLSAWKDKQLQFEARFNLSLS
jgi:hypothetical protein